LQGGVTRPIVRRMDLERARRIVAPQGRANRKYQAKRRSFVILGRAVADAVDEHKRRLRLLDLESESEHAPHSRSEQLARIGSIAPASAPTNPPFT
jgi:hypothetical protein